MKIIFLNVWDGQVNGDLGHYLHLQAPSTDIFCFQESFENMERLGKSLLANYTVYSKRKFIKEDDTFAQTIYVKKYLNVVSFGSLLEGQASCGLGLYVEIRGVKDNIFVCNVHGISNPVTKLDTAGRTLQSRELIAFFRAKGLTVIGGDFNLLPQTQSVQVFSEQGYQDLIKTFNIETTRNRLIWDQHPDSKQYYSDYVFLSPGMRVKSFNVPKNEISDHLPLELEVHHTIGTV